MVLTGTLDECPLKASILCAKTCFQNHVLTVSGGALHGSTIRALHALPSTRVTGVSAPATVGLLQTLTTGTQSRAVLSCDEQREKVRKAI